MIAKTGRNRFRQAAAVGVVATILALAAACGGSGEQSGGGAKEVELDDFYFKPAALTLVAGKTATLKLENEGKVLHTFTVSSLGIDVNMPSGSEQTITVTPDKAGTFALVCTIHKDSNKMVGTLTVTGSSSTSQSSGTSNRPGPAETTPASNQPAYGY